VSKVSSACHNALGRALEQLETVMEQEGVWPKKMPAEQELKNATESAVPFAVDCLAFESWLAFIFIPKMRILLKQEMPFTTHANYTCSRNISVIGVSAHSVPASSY